MLLCLTPESNPLLPWNAAFSIFFQNGHYSQGPLFHFSEDWIRSVAAKKKVQRKGKDLTFCKAANFMESPNRLRHLIPSTSLNGSSLTHMLSQCNQPSLVLRFCHLACLPKAPLYVSKQTTLQPLSKFRPLPGIHVSIHPV